MPTNLDVENQLVEYCSWLEQHLATSLGPSEDALAAGEQSMRRRPSHVWMLAAVACVLLAIGGIAVLAPRDSPSQMQESATGLTEVPTSGPATATAPPLNTPLNTVGSVPSGILYVVQSGDMMLSIAAIFCVTVDEIVDENGWSDGVRHMLHLGDAIRIPASACLPSTPSGVDDGGAAIDLPAATGYHVGDRVQPEGTVRGTTSNPTAWMAVSIDGIVVGYTQLNFDPPPPPGSGTLNPYPTTIIYGEQRERVGEFIEGEPVLD